MMLYTRSSKPKRFGALTQTAQNRRLTVAWQFSSL